MAPQTLNRYTYCLNNPLKFIDPDGLKSRYYFGDNENPVKGTPRSYLIAGLWLFAGFVLFFAILFPGAIPAAIQLLVHSGWKM